MSAVHQNSNSFCPSRFFRSQSLRRSVVATVISSLLAMTASPALAAGCSADFDGDGAIGGSDLAVMVGAWGGSGAADLDGNGIVDGADLGSLLGTWGPCTPACSGFTDMAFASEAVTLPGVLGTVILSGVIHVTPFGAPDGLVTAGLPGGFTSLVEMHPGVMNIHMSDVLLELAPFGPTGMVLVNSVPTSSSSVLTTFNANVFSGAPIASWAPASRAMLALAALANDGEWACNVAAARALPFDTQGQGFWCKAAAYSAACAITVLATAGCAALTAGCGAASTVTLGGMVVPCVWAIALCAGGVFIGAAATYEGVLAFWGDQQN